jgi:CheY-like chemotaxis protein
MTRILMIVDNDFDDRYFFRNAVKEIGRAYECVHAEHGVEALEKLRTSDQLPDIIFLDLNMPLMNGWKCLEELKCDEKLKNISVIIYTTSDSREDMELSRTLGADYYLTKPPDLADLPQKINEALLFVEAKK